jgi:hypothetical protein
MSITGTVKLSSLARPDIVNETLISSLYVVSLRENDKEYCETLPNPALRVL